MADTGFRVRPDFAELLLHASLALHYPDVSGALSNHEVQILGEGVDALLALLDGSPVEIGGRMMSLVDAVG